MGKTWYLWDKGAYPVSIIRQMEHGANPNPPHQGEWEYEKSNSNAGNRNREPTLAHAIPIHALGCADWLAGWQGVRRTNHSMAWRLVAGSDFQQRGMTYSQYNRIHSRPTGQLPVEPANWYADLPLHIVNQSATLSINSSHRRS
jgi:hypothetical protein